MIRRIRLTRGPAVALLLGALLAPTVGANDVPGSALDFDGTDDFVRVPYDESFDMTAAVTAEAWVKPTSADGGVVGVWGAGGLDDKFLLYFDAGKPRARIVRDGHAGSTNAIGAALAPGVWYHLAMTYDGATLRLYVNGGQVASTAAVGTLPLTDDRDLQMGLEDIVAGVDNHLDGVIDEVRVWDVARTATQLATFMNQTVDPDTPGLVGAWRCDEASGTQAVLDETSNGNDGTLGTDAAVAADDPTRGASTAPMRWEFLGNALAGNLGLPQLTGSGTLQAASVVSLNLSSANPSAAAALVIGANAIYAPLKGGILVPDDDLIIFGLPVTAVGTYSLNSIWPGGLPARSEFYFQFWIPDAVGRQGYAASNGLLAESP